jgi:hypothetical protein
MPWAALVVGSALVALIVWVMRMPSAKPARLLDRQRPKTAGERRTDEAGGILMLVLAAGV